MAEKKNAALDTLLNVLKTSGADAWEVTDLEEKGWEFYFIRHSLDQHRAKDVRSFNVKVFKKFEDCLGSAEAAVPVDASEAEMRRTVEGLCSDASYVRNPFYTLNKPCEVETADQEAENIDLEAISGDFIRTLASVPETVTEDLKQINIYSDIIKGQGGLPVGTAGKGMLLLSGGIDSPVAGWMVAKRGVKVDAVYFHAPPYTSERAKQKVVDLAKLVSKYSGEMNLYVVNFTDIQMYIYDKCPHEELTIIMRRYMMKIAEAFAEKEGSQCLITGESIGQVASQTTQSLAATNEVCTLPVFRPLIAFDKQEIVDVSLKIDTYETSILPYEDCCTTFVAKHPVTKPNIERIKKSELNLAEKIDDMMTEAIESAELVKIM